MPDEERVRKRRPRVNDRARFPGLNTVFDATDDMITFVETYQKVWESESKAMHALGEFLGARSDSLRYQVELMRMGSDTFRRYSRWSETLLGLRPEAFAQAWLDTMERFRLTPLRDAARTEDEPEP
jgi:hypothetical protein